MVAAIPSMSSPLIRYGLLACVITITLLVTFLSYSDLSPSISRFSTAAAGTFTASDPVWLIATMTLAKSLSRHSIIRATWQRLYASDNPNIRCVFVLSNPGPWIDIVKAENETYGDLVVLSHLEESAHVANTVKSIEFLKYFRDSGRFLSYRFVSKLDDDSFLSALAFYTQYLHPNLNPDLDIDNTDFKQRLMIGRPMDRFVKEYPYPGGQFYTLSTSLAHRLSTLHDENPINDEHEDRLVGRLLHEAGETPDTFTFIKLPNQQAFDVDDNVEDLSGWVHRMGEGAINPHKMKTDEEYLRVARMFGEEGVNMTAVAETYGWLDMV
ncbi:hypothetical protein SAICODRAFT_29006 [Saitoella complicata NRRL Y-17804]|uniref:uncharacterized protein n=1 Tax=Saitoella complicata (strain BCRC 22490 / CBS 7301 / JCM 7358 / NBRC 10748 / NRRL Y-17804) TaxID=698492 RepID=UPI000867AD70|nr:uncharacterized protein SAICODRAFT_29006 [Saitoella complicata NRRL Y-17804]ODQ55380.1 hypothetical protein SAICODRAFT_29006 [Saitoella complicata NRRL Y-17804]